MMPGSGPSPDSELSSNRDAADSGGPRVWRACLPCRRKKVKCDGKQPCYNCSSRNQDCGFPVSNDNASASRHYATSFEARCQQMTSLCDRLENLAGQLTQSIQTLNDSSGALPGATDKAQSDLIQAAQVLRSMPDLQHTGQHEHENQQHPLALSSLTDTSPQGIHNAFSAVRPHGHPDYLPQIGDEDLDSVADNTERDAAVRDARASRDVGALVRDSYGYPRFIGGASSSVLIEAAQSVSPHTAAHMPLTDQGSVQVDNDRQHTEIPIFVRGKVWPELPFLPRPEQLTKPPQYVSDLLIRLYFDQLHYTLPVVFKPHFMKSYRQMTKETSQSAQNSSAERRFLMIFYAICACASSLLPSTSDTGFPGLEHYEKALLLYYASTGEASLERVQCLALLSMCAAGWNTLTQSWTLAGQAVRAAQDIGIHLSRRMMVSHPATSATPRTDLLEQHISRRIWWSVYILDRSTSICLGRPMAAHDEDCDWELPLNMSDEQLERQFSSTTAQRATYISPLDPPSITGFLAFTRLCRISGKIQQLSTPHRLRELTSSDPDRSARFLARVSAYDQSLQDWIDNLPDSIRFSANKASSETSGGQDLIMCVVSFIVHAGSLLNLYRCLIGHSSQSPTTTPPESINPAECVAQCKSAARSCINAAEMVRDLVPPSHYLAICVHYLTLSGVVLLRLPSDQPQSEIFADVEKCAGFLKSLEQRWSGAARSRAIVEKLLEDCRNAAASSQVTRQGEGDASFHNTWAGFNGKRPFEPFADSVPSEAVDDDFYLNQLLGTELFAFENANTGLMGPWGRL